MTPTLSGGGSVNPARASDHREGDKATFYEELARELDALLKGEPDLVANAANAAAAIYHALPNVNWVGFYFLRGHELVLGPFRGRPACVRIGLGKGVCGLVASQQRSILVPDVEAFPGHIACDPATRSELVVPLVKDAELLGVLDLDSPILARFDEADRVGCEMLARVIARNLSVDSSVAKKEPLIKIFGSQSAALYDFRTGLLVTGSQAEFQPDPIKPLAAQYFSVDRGPIVSFEYGILAGANAKDGPYAVTRFQNSTETYSFRISSGAEARRAFRVVLVYIIEHRYIQYIERFDLAFGNYIRDLAKLRRAYNLMNRLHNKAIALPKTAPVKWPGAKKADLVSFLQTHYGRFMGNGLTMAWIWQHDRPLYQAIHYAKKVHKFPEYIVIPSERDMLKEVVRKFVESHRTNLAEANLTPKEKQAAVRKARRSAAPHM